MYTDDLLNLAASLEAENGAPAGKLVIFVPEDQTKSSETRKGFDTGCYGKTKVKSPIRVLFWHLDFRSELLSITLQSHAWYGRRKFSSRDW